MKTLYFVAGEASADNHGAALIRALRKMDADLRFIGRGGPQMKMVAGENFNNWIDQSGVLGLWEVIKHYGYFRKQFHETLREITESKPTAVVLIDYPGFNLRLARALRKESSSQKIIYYISPQVWAWNRGRIKKMARWLDLMLCIFPFEADLYNESGLRTVFVGHPMIERLRAKKIDPLRAQRAAGSQNQLDRPEPSKASAQNERPVESKVLPAIGGSGDIQRDPNLVGLFPGSRSREIRKMFPILIETADELRRLKPNLRFEVAAASDELVQEMRKILADSLTTPHLPPPRGHRATSNPLPPERGEERNATRDVHPLPSAGGEGRVRGDFESQGREWFEVKVGQTAEIMQRAAVGIVASGSATLEAAYFRMPFVLIYKVAWPTYFAGRLLVKVKYLGMPNVLAGREIVPEFIQNRARADDIAEAIARLIDDSSARQQMISEFDKIAAQLGESGASDRAAEAVLVELS